MARRILGMASLARPVSYEPLKLPPYPVSTRPRCRFEEWSDVLLACRMDLDPDIIFWAYRQLTPDPDHVRDGAFVYLDKSGCIHLASFAPQDLSLFALERHWLIDNLEASAIRDEVTRLVQLPSSGGGL